MGKTNIIPTHRLVYYDVVNPSGEDLGQVQEFMLDVAHGRIAFVVVSFGGILGLTDKWFALPWEILEWSPSQKKFVLSMPRQVLENAPGLDKKKWPEEIDLSWLSMCYAYYGCAPYWEAPVVDEAHIKKLAYSIWEGEGHPEQKALEHYYQAEKMLKEQESRRLHPAEFASIKPSRKSSPQK